VNGVPDPMKQETASSGGDHARVAASAADVPVANIHRRTSTSQMRRCSDVQCSIMVSVCTSQPLAVVRVCIHVYTLRFVLLTAVGSRLTTAPPLFKNLTTSVLGASRGTLCVRRFTSVLQNESHCVNHGRI